MADPPNLRSLPNPESSEEVNLQDLWRALARGRWLILAMALLGLGLGALAVSLIRPVFESTALLRIIPEESGFDLGASSSSSMRLLLGLDDSGDVQTAIGLLTSRRIAEGVVDSLALHVVLKAPDRPRDRVLTVLEAPRATRRARVDLRRASDGTYSIATSAPDASPLARVAIGEPFRAAGLLLRLDPELASAPPPRIRVELRPYQETVRAVQDRLVVTQGGAGAHLVRLRYRHTDSIKVAAVPDLAMRQFIAYRNATSTEESHTILGFLRDQQGSYQDDLRSMENRLQRFLEDVRSIEPTTEAEEQAKRLAELQAERERLETERESLSALLRQIEAAPRSPEQQSPYRQLIAFPAFLANTMVQNILHSIIVIENERSELLIRRTARDPDVVGRTRRIEELEAELHRVARNYLGDQELRLAALNSSLARFAAGVAALPAREVELRRLRRETELLEEVYQMIELKLKEEEIRAAAQLANVQIVDAPFVPDEPEFPRAWVVLLLGALVGGFGGAGLSALRAAARPTVNSQYDIGLATAGLPVLATIDLRHLPARGTDRPRHRLLPRLSNGKGGTLAIGTGRPAEWRSPRLPINAAGAASDPLGDAYRSLRTNVGGRPPSERGAVLVLAGVDAGDDGGLTAANLAIAFAQQGTRVVLVDADLRRGLLHSWFGVARQPGLAEVLEDPTSLSQALQAVDVGRRGATLDLLGTGVCEHNPADAVASSAMSELVERLRESHEQVIVAAPAAGLAPDAALLARLADRILLIVTAGTTSRSRLAATTRELQQLRVQLEGVVMHDRH